MARRAWGSSSSGTTSRAISRRRRFPARTRERWLGRRRHAANEVCDRRRDAICSQGEVSLDFSDGALGSEDKLIDLVSETFAISEGSDEGALIGQLVRRLLCDTPARDIRVFTARHEGELVGGAIFSRLEYSEDPRSVFLLSPMAVAPYRQGQGVWQALRVLQRPCHSVFLLAGSVGLSRRSRWAS